MNTCIHPENAEYVFDVPSLGMMRLCWDCRREIVLRCHLFEPIGLVSVCGGRLGYRCKKCQGDYTMTDPGTCKCEGRKEDCANELAAQKRWSQFAELTIWKPKRKRVAA